MLYFLSWFGFSIGRRLRVWGLGLRRAECRPMQAFRLLGGSGVVISRVISRVTILVTHIRGLITLLITTHEPPSTGQLRAGWGWAISARPFENRGIVLNPCTYQQMGSCQNYGPFLGTLNNRCRTILGTQQGTTILTSRSKGPGFRRQGFTEALTQTKLCTKTHTVRVHEMLNLSPACPHPRALSIIKLDNS